MILFDKGKYKKFDSHKLQQEAIMQIKKAEMLIGCKDTLIVISAKRRQCYILCFCLHKI